MKKRILSLILALSMVLSVLPMGAFAEGSNQDLVIGSDGYPVGTSGNGWSYDDYTKKLTLTRNSGTYNFSSTHPQNPSAGTQPAPAVLCAIVISSGATITGGTFAGSVTNWSTISGGTFQNTCSVTNHGTIKDNGIFEGEVTNNTSGTIFGGTFNETVTNSGNIKDGTFAGSVQNNNRISGGTFQKMCSVTNYGNIEKGTFEGSVTNGGAIDGGKFEGTVINNSTISDGAFTDLVDNKYIIKGGTFRGEVTNSGTITGDGTTFEKLVTNNGNIYNGTFEGSVTNRSTIRGGTFQNTCSVENWRTIEKGTFNGKVSNNQGGNITNGTFEQEVINNAGGEISGGTFKGTVLNGNGIITGGTFAAGLSKNDGSVTGGIFNGKTGLTDALQVTVTNGSVSQVNDEGPLNADGTTGTAWDLYSYKDTTMTITADTEIFSLNGRLLGEGDRVNGNKKTVKFTMPDKDVVLSTGELVMENGLPDCPVGTIGNGWEYSDGTLTLTRGTFDFSSTHPQGKTPGTPTTTPVACAIEIQSGAEITDGTFNGDVANEGTIEKGTFNGEVENRGTINNGTFAANKEVKNYGTINNGTFAGNVRNERTIENGTFKDRVINVGTINNGIFEENVENDYPGKISDGAFSSTVENYSGIIEKGTFKGTVENWGGTISGGTFAGSVNNRNGGTVTGGVFNSKTTQKPATDAYSITLDEAYPGAKIEKVNDVSAEWDPYVVVAELTMNQKVIITASTEIYSLNHKPIGAGNCNSAHDGNENTVKFTMPNANVVLNGAITSTDLVMENGWPKDSNGGKTPCKGDGWEYIPNDPTYGNMLLLTGSNQTGGLFDFSTIGDGAAVECNVFVGKPTAITGGEFNGKVFNNSGILGGTFHGEVDNMGPGRIVNGTFNGEVENNGTIEKGTFKNMCRVINNRTIENGTFEGTVENNTNGTISGGTFAGSVSNNGGTVTGGVFNGNATLINVTGGHNITWDAASPKAKIEKVNGVPAEWAPYVVTSNATTKEVTITADTEIFSLNGQPIAESSYGVDKKTVTFTMPDDDVVLNGELITKPEPEPKPEPKPEPEPEPKPEPEPTTYTVTVIGGTIDGKTSVSAKENDTLTVVLDQNDIPDGMTFDLWSISSSKLSGDINVDYRAEAMTFQMPAEDVTIRAQYRSAEIIEDAAPSPLATAATVAVGGAAAGIVVWQGVNLGVDLYLANALPQGVPVPTDRRALALLLWETAGKPEVALPTLYGDIPAEEIELQKATRWAVQNGLMDAADKKDASFFDPDHYVTKMDVFGAWLRLKKLLGTT